MCQKEHLHRENPNGGIAPFRAPLSMQHRILFKHKKRSAWESIAQSTQRPSRMVTIAVSWQGVPNVALTGLASIEAAYPPELCGSARRKHY